MRTVVSLSFVLLFGNLFELVYVQSTRIILTISVCLFLFRLRQLYQARLVKKCIFRH